MAAPESIKRHRPQGFGAVEIRDFNGRYPVYRYTSVWDAAAGRPRKKTLACIGKITEQDGFIPNKEGLRLMREMAAAAGAGHADAAGGEREPPGAAVSTPACPRVRNYGAYEMLRQLSPALRGQLRAVFPDIFRELEAHALLRLVDGACTSRSFHPAFWASYLSDECPDLNTGPAAVCQFISALGLDEARCEEFMRSFCSPGSTVFFDGTAFFSRSQDTLSARGYNPQHRADPQSRLLYAFDRNAHRPLFYQVLQGNSVDRTTFLQALKAAGCRDCLVIADKGFYSKRNQALLEELGLSYILPLQDNSALIPRELYDSPSSASWHGVFPFHKRAIDWCRQSVGRQGHAVYVFRDEQRWAEERGRQVTRSGGSGTDPQAAFAEERMGCMAFITNLTGQGAEQVWRLYKERWYIEECFCRLKHKVSPHASYAHTDEFKRGWCFLNHVALLYYYGLINALREKELNRQYTPDEIIRQGRNIYLITGPDGTSELSMIFSETQNILDKLGINLIRQNR